MFCFGTLTENLSNPKLIWQVDNLAGLMQNVGLAMVTILIPFAIAIIVEILQQKRNGETDFADLDLHVVLDRIFNLTRILICIGLLFISPLFWEASIPCVRTILLLCWVAGIMLTANILKNLYHWTRGNVDECRLSYLKEVNNLEDIVVVWKSVWKTKHTNVQNEGHYFSVFSQKIDALVEDKKNLALADKLLNDFKFLLDKRSLIFLVSPGGVFSKTLEWHFKIWEQRKKYIRQDEDISIWANYNNILNSLDYIVRFIMEKSLKEKESYLCFNAAIKHISDKNKNAYLNHLFIQFYFIFFENIHESPERYDIWKEYFPNEWKITKANLHDPENSIAKISSNEFFRWASNRIMSPDTDYDARLDEIARNLFPDLDPMIWAAILIFVYCPSADSERPKFVIETRWTFGMITTFIGSTQEEIEAEELQYRKNTIELALLLFKNQFQKQKLVIYIEQLQKLTIYDVDSKEERRRLGLLRIFEDMLQALTDEPCAT